MKESEVKVGMHVRVPEEGEWDEATNSMLPLYGTVHSFRPVDRPRFNNAIGILRDGETARKEHNGLSFDNLLWVEPWELEQV